jgi:hypothetical protein
VDYGTYTLLPACWADLTVLVGELEGLDDTKGLLDRAANGKVVDGGSTKGTVTVDDEGAAESDTLLREKNVVGLGDRVVAVGKLSSQFNPSMAGR